MPDIKRRTLYDSA